MWGKGIFKRKFWKLVRLVTKLFLLVFKAWILLALDTLGIIDLTPEEVDGMKRMIFGIYEKIKEEDGKRR